MRIKHVGFTLIELLIVVAIIGILVAIPALLWADEPFDYFQNSWNVIGLKDYINGTRVTPNNELLLGNKTKIRFRYGPDQIPLSRKQTKTCMEGWLPVLLLTARDGDVRYDFTLWATPLPSVKDWRKAFDWPSEGENFLNWVRVKITNTGATQATAKLAVDRVGQDGTSTQAFTWALMPGQSAEKFIRIPFTPVEDPSASANEPQLWLDRTVEYWRGLLAKAAQIEVPSPKATEALRAAHVCQLIASDHGELHGGEGFYDEFYIRDGGYQIMELEEARLCDAVNHAIKSYLRHQRPDGRFETQRDELDGNGQAIWVLWQYYKIMGDHDWLQKVYPQMRRAVDWIKKARRQAPPESPFAGLLPNARADGEYLWDGNHHIVGYDFWNLRGLLCTIDAARALGRTHEAKELKREAQDYRAAIDKAWKRTGLTYFPPSWEKEGTHWGDTETLWPTELFAPNDPRVTALLDEVRHRFGGGFIEGAIRWLGRPNVIHPYMSSYSTMASLIRGEDEQFLEEFYWYLLHTTATQAFPEGIYYKRRYAWNETIPHVTGASNFSLMLRHMLIHEEGNKLHLLLGAPDWWLGPGKEIRVENAPTHFGLMSLRTIGVAEGVKVRINLPRRNPPDRIILHLPKSRPLVGDLKGVEVQTRPDQKKRWDFATVVNRYKKNAPKLNAEWVSK